MKRILSLLLAILMTVSVLASCGNKKDGASGSPDGGSNTENTEPIEDDRSEISIAENVVTYDDAETAKIVESVVSTESTSEGAVLNVKKGTALDELSVNEIFVLSGDKAADFGGLYFAKIKSVEDNGDTISYTVEAPAMDEVFTEVDIDFSKEMTFDNIASIETFDGVTVAPLDENYVESLGMSVGNRPSSFYGSNGEASSMGIDPSFNGKDLKIEYDIDLKKFFESDKGEENEKTSAEEAKNIKVYYTDTGKCYHKDDCQYLYDSKHETTLDDAVNVRKLRSCTVCKPAIPENASPDWIKTNSALTLSGEVSLYDMAVSVVSENGNMWTLKDGFDNLAIRTQGRLFASAKLDGNFEIELGGKTTKQEFLDDLIVAEGLKEKTFPLVYIKYNGANFSVMMGDAAYNNPELLSVGLLIYADIHGNISASTTFYCEYEKNIVHDFDIFREGKFLGIGASERPNQSSDGRFDWYISAEMDADVEFDVIGCSVLLFVGNVNIMELSLMRAGVEVDGNMSFYASPNKTNFSANGNICCFVELMELSFKLKAEIKNLIDENWENELGPLIRFDIWEASAGYSTDPEPESISGGVKYTLSDDGTYYTVSGVKEEIDGRVKIPTSYYGLPVKWIEDYAFQNCTKLTGVTIGRNVEYIGASAFYGCDKLTNVTFVSGGMLKEIGTRAFYGCESLAEIYIPDGVKILGDGVFMYCYGLVTASLPNSITEMGIFVFGNCTSLETANIPFGLKVIPDQTFFECKKLKAVSIPYGVTEIKNRAFAACEAISEIKIPDSVESVETYAFASCKGATCLKIGKNVSYLGEYVFNNCQSLKTINFPTDPKFNDIPEGAFSSCYGLETLVITDGIEYIGSDAFVFCKGLKNVIIGKDVTEIGFDAFSSCYSLEKVEIQGNLRKIYGEAFQHCGELKSINIPDSVEEIGRDAFYQAGLIEITLPSSLENLEPCVFYQCYELKKVTIGSNVRTIGGSAFYDCMSLEQVIIPNDSKLEYIKSYAFYETRIKSINLPNTLKSIESCAFKLSSLESIVIPDSVTEIGASAFENCLHLKSVVIGNRITQIGASTFDGCTALESITVPVSVTQIKYDAINRCGKLTDINYGGTKAQWSAIKKDTGWNYSSGAYEINCADGALLKSEG